MVITYGEKPKIQQIWVSTTNGQNNESNHNLKKNGSK